MTNRKNRFNLFKNDKFKLKLKNRGAKKQSKYKTNDEKSESSDFLSFDSIIPENSPLKNNSNSSSGFYNDEFSLKDNLRYNSRNNSKDNLRLNSRNNSRGNSRDNSDAKNDLDEFDEKYSSFKGR